MFTVQQCGVGTYVIKLAGQTIGGISLQPDTEAQVLDWLRGLPVASKQPEFAAITTQKQIDSGINGFAVELLAESFAQRREQAGDGTLFLVGYGKDRRPVYMLLSSVAPEFLPAEMREAIEARYQG